ncbi:MAG: GNAT family N-acetyltransferase [Clostridiaceae bacterium]|nr:GNAT family N-acetyltransferase [Clostridiaceae bacterium]
MIIPVSKENEKNWADLCSALWPDNSPEDFLDERARGKLPYEYLCYMDGKPRGFISLSVRTDYVEGCSEGPVAYIEGIYVEKKFRRRGVARELIEYAKVWALAHDCHELASDCELENKVSEAFHRKVGFKEVNRIIAFSMKVKP